MIDKRITTDMIIDVLTEIQVMSGEREHQITDQICPLRDLPGFDSLRALEATIMLEERLDVRIGGQANLFITEDGTNSLTVQELAEKMNNVVSRKKVKKNE